MRTEWTTGCSQVNDGLKKSNSRKRRWFVLSCFSSGRRIGGFLVLANTRVSSMTLHQGLMHMLIIKTLSTLNLQVHVSQAGAKFSSTTLLTTRGATMYLKMLLPILHRSLSGTRIMRTRRTSHIPLTSTGINSYFACSSNG